jgi:hypothetical protein
MFEKSCLSDSIGDILYIEAFVAEKASKVGVPERTLFSSFGEEERLRSG